MFGVCIIYLLSLCSFFFFVFYILQEHLLIINLEGLKHYCNLNRLLEALYEPALHMITGVGSEQF